ncbi:MAG: hypothetical protein REI78_04310 [Pedobacter sp.]|nr:hypothetical protein [Pedobacter sp.]
MDNPSRTAATSSLQKFFSVVLGLLMILAALGHFTFQRSAFQAQVPDWVPLEKDLTVILSGVVELILGLALLFWKRRQTIGIILAIFYVLVFPGNLAQYTNHIDAFGLDTDSKRLIRLFFQPILIFWALWSTGVFNKKRIS